LKAIAWCSRAARVSHIALQLLLGLLLNMKTDFGERDEFVRQ